jgi:hypothetical protein
MNLTRYQQLVDSLNTIATKVLSAIPIAEAWPRTRIQSELHRSTRALIDRRVLEGCIAKLVDVGLVKEVEPGCYKRVPVPMKVVQLAPPIVETKPQERIVQNDKQVAAAGGSMDALAAAAGTIRRMATELAKVAKDIEDAALQAQQEVEAERGKSVQFDQLRSLMKSIGAS